MKRLLLPALAAVLLCGCMSRTERLFQRAEMFLSQGQMELAAQEYYRLATQYPRSSFAPNALYKLAYLHREEFGSPEKAIQTYRVLAEKHPDSPYADEAWLWILQTQGEQLKDLAGMRATCATIRERFPDDPRVCATAQLQLARTLLAQGQLPAAEAEARALPQSYPHQERQCAAAMLVVARVMEKRGGKQSDQAVKAYEQIVSKYPDTPSAIEAKRSIGWLYYGLRGQHIKEEQQAKVRAARVIGNVPAIPARDSFRLKPLACLSSLLAAAGVAVAPEELLVVSGAAFDFWFDADRPDAARFRLPRNALSAAAEQYGFSVNVSAVAPAEAGFASLSGAIAAGHPAMVPIGDSGEWWVVSGYKPAEDIVYVLKPGQRAAQGLPRAQFLGRWAGSPSGHVRCVTGPYFQLSLGPRSGAADAAAVVRGAARRAVELKASVASGYGALADRLAKGSPEGDDEARQHLRNWAQRRLPEILSERQMIARFLSEGANSAPDAREALEGAARSYDEAVGLGQQLGATVLGMTAPAPDAQTMPEQYATEAAALARQMQDAEEHALQQLAAVAH